MKFLSGLLCAALLVACGSKAPEGSFVQSESGVVVTPASGNAKRVRLEVRSDRIVRVTAVADENLELPASLIVVGTRPAAVPFKVERQGNDLSLATAQIVAHVSLADGAVRFTDLAGKPLLEEAAT